ncbi:hypothetical protein J1N35_000634 [Gossypium stocksii]|uniref:Uncharacterized protein n=1 Tax=Gossypium stocksii TaxID=47602 RepID=A0A9D4AKP4_9ROSI|nr:hypothetical protein J1N35_000634 [Gossypium stocksii]
MQSLEENNKQIRETVSKLASFYPIAQIQLVNGDDNTSNETTLLDVNTNKGNNIFFNPLSFGNTNTNIVNPSFTIVRTTPTILGAFIGVCWYFIHDCF